MLFLGDYQYKLHANIHILTSSIRVCDISTKGKHLKPQRKINMH